MAKKKTVLQRVIALEDREGILYSYIDELRAYTKKADKRFSEFIVENEKRMEQNETMIRDIVQMQGYILKLIDKMDDKLDHHGDKLTDHDNRLSLAGI
jgi:hypothetical protein